MIKSQCYVNRGSLYFGIGYLISDIISRRRHCIQFVYTVWLDQQYPPPPFYFGKKAHNRFIHFDIYVYEVFLYRFKAFGYTLCQWCEELMEQLLKIQYLVLLTAKNIVLF